MRSFHLLIIAFYIKPQVEDNMFLVYTEGGYNYMAGGFLTGGASFLALETNIGHHLLHHQGKYIYYGYV